MVKKRARAARAMVTRVVGHEEGDGDGGNMTRENDDCLVPVVVQQAVLYLASASLDDAGNDGSKPLTTCCQESHLVLQQVNFLTQKVL